MFEINKSKLKLNWFNSVQVSSLSDGLVKPSTSISVCLLSLHVRKQFCEPREDSDCSNTSCDSRLFEPYYEKTSGFRPGPTQTELRTATEDGYIYRGLE